MQNQGYIKAIQWFSCMGWHPLSFQEETWQAYLAGKSGLVNAPTGSGKTYSILIGELIDFINTNDDQQNKSFELRLIWITPIRALAKEILLACQKAIAGFGLDWRAELRTGDSTGKEKKEQLRNPPQILITTPESLHVLMATQGYPVFFSTLKTIVIDEWHELIGSKRGVQTELAISRLQNISKNLKIWGISATIGNMQEAIDVLLYSVNEKQKAIIKSDIEKKISLHSVIPVEMETYPWAGHLGLRLADEVLNIIYKSKTSLIFTNTRAQCEIWYQKLLELKVIVSHYSVLAITKVFLIASVVPSVLK